MKICSPRLNHSRECWFSYEMDVGFRTFLMLLLPHFFYFSSYSHGSPTFENNVCHTHHHGDVHDFLNVYIHIRPIQNFPTVKISSTFSGFLRQNLEWSPSVLKVDRYAQRLGHAWIVPVSVNFEFLVFFTNRAVSLELWSG